MPNASLSSQSFTAHVMLRQGAPLTQVKSLFSQGIKALRMCRPAAVGSSDGGSDHSMRSRGSFCDEGATPCISCETLALAHLRFGLALCEMRAGSFDKAADMLQAIVKACGLASSRRRARGSSGGQRRIRRCHWLDELDQTLPASSSRLSTMGNITARLTWLTQLCARRRMRQSRPSMLSNGSWTELATRGRRSRQRATASQQAASLRYFRQKLVTRVKAALLSVHLSLQRIDMALLAAYDLLKVRPGCGATNRFYYNRCGKVLRTD